jgi:prepilin peptidase CpaA
MLSAGLLLALLAVAAYTDIRYRKVYNWTAYPGILVALAVSGLNSLLVEGVPARFMQRWVGGVGLADAGLGFAACGLVMLVCYVFGAIGGGDVKLVAMLGAFLGLEKGFQVMLWTCVLGGAAGLVVLVWRVGVWRLFVDGCRWLLAVVRVGRAAQAPPATRAGLKTRLFLAPMAIPAVLIVEFHLLEGVI